MEPAERTIVIADDEDFLRLLVTRTLAGYRLLEARDGEEAIALVRDAMPDLLILDWMMPGRDGPEVLAILRADAATRAVPILMMTARCGPAERRRLLAAGATECLAKPFATQALRACVEEVLSRSAEGDPADRPAG